MIKNKFVDYLQRIWYKFVGGFLTVFMRLYFKRWQTFNLPKSGRGEPVIYVANHQNAFLDALVIIFSNNKQPIFLVRANIFAKRIARFFLRSFNMFPIYRQRDGVNVLAKNEKIIQDCIDILLDGRQPLSIFVEGNHSMRRTLRPIKKGVARIAFSALEQSNFNLNLRIIPIGIAYSRHTRVRSDLLVNFGEPIFVKDYLKTYNEHANKAYLQLSKDISSELTKLVVNISDTQNYEEVEKAWISQKVIFDNMQDELHNDQKIIARLIQEKKDGKKLEIKEQKKKKKSILGMILGFPAFVYGLFNFLPLYFLLDRILKKVVTDIHFYGSIKVAVGTFLGGLLCVLQTIAVYSLTGGSLWITVVYFVSWPFFGIFALDHYEKYYSDEPHTTSSADLLVGYK